MATANIYHEENNTTYKVTFEIQSNILDDGIGVVDYFLKIKTTIKLVDGTGFGDILIRDLTDTPPSSVAFPFSSPAANFTILCNQWVQYFLQQAGYGQSSSSSSTYGYSSSSSSEGYSSSSSSSSEGYSSSSSSSSSDSSGG